jgi:hypothetical protein
MSVLYASFALKEGNAEKNISKKALELITKVVNTLDYEMDWGKIEVKKLNELNYEEFNYLFELNKYTYYEIIRRVDPRCSPEQYKKLCKLTGKTIEELTKKIARCNLQQFAAKIEIKKLSCTDEQYAKLTEIAKRKPKFPQDEISKTQADRWINEYRNLIKEIA